MTKRPHIIVVGNSKGGSGKSTVSMHLIASLLAMDLKVGSIDLDASQATLTRYIENRHRRAADLDPPPPLPDHMAVYASGDAATDAANLAQALERLADDDVIVIDTPGSENELSRQGHALADTLITPLNDSFVDLDVLAVVEPNTFRIAGPSHYAEMVWETRKEKALRGEHASFEWIVMRNRLSHLDARNKREMERLLDELSKRFRFRLVSGLGERVIYRELFLEGMTLLDLRAKGAAELSMSQVAARQELRRLVDAVGLAKLAEKVRATVG